MKSKQYTFKKCESLEDCEKTNCYECDGLISSLQPPYRTSCMDMYKQNQYMASVSPVYQRNK